MKINDLEKLTGLKRSNIFYYEREGLLAPRREDNNYRDYTEDDLRRLKTIVVFRKLGFTVAEIGDLLEGRRTLADVLPENTTRLNDKAEELAAAAAMCREMERRELTMERFDADEWFEALENKERQGRRFVDILGDAADDVTKTIAFVQESVGMYGPVYAMYFLSPEGVRKRRLWKWYWIGIALAAIQYVALPLLAPRYFPQQTHLWATLAFLVLQGVVGSLVLLFCARHIIPNRSPKRAFWLTFACTLASSILLTLAGQPVLMSRTVSDEYRYASEVIEDPLAYVQENYNDRYYGGHAELQAWEAGDQTFVLTSWGSVFRFSRNEDGTWQDLRLAENTDASGVLYTADPYGPEAYPSRLMLADGTVIEPVYEAHFSTGYIPVFAFDLSDGETYRGVLFGTDANGGLHYELRASYAIQPEGAAANDVEQFRWFSHAALLQTADGAAFLSAWRDFRASVWQTEPTTVLEAAYPGINWTYRLAAQYIAPPSLVASRSSCAWSMAEYNEIIYPLEGSWRYVWNRASGADVTALLYAETVTPELLREAAASTVRAEEVEWSGDVLAYHLPYAETRIWDGVPLPDGLYSQGQSVRAELRR